MWPTARSGDVLIVAPDCRVLRGDLVVVRVGADLIAHRCVAREGTMLRCANARGVLDPWVSAAAVYGRVLGIERRGRLLCVPRFDRVSRLLASPHLRRLTRLVWGVT
jgi:hypothetical protein